MPISSAPSGASRRVPTPVIAAVRIWPSAVASITASWRPSSIENSSTMVSDLPLTLIQFLKPQMPSPVTEAPSTCIASFAATIRWPLGMFCALPSASIGSTRASASMASGNETIEVTSASVIQIGDSAMCLLSFIPSSG